MASTPLHLLQTIFGYHSFRGQQSDIIEHICQGGDALVLMPTGGGKSLCYQIPALIRPGLTVVVSPLIALMQDQVNALLQLGVRAACLNSSLSFSQAQDISQQLRNGELDLIYVAPERLLTERFLSFMDSAPMALFAIDEAHCVSQWGHDFRPEYAQLSILHERYPQVPRIALTATADGPTRREIIQRLQLEQAQCFVSAFDRPNIRYRVMEKRRPREQLLDFIQQEHNGDAGIVYCMSRKKVEDTALWLQQQNLSALPYHAGMPGPTRKLHQERFLQEEGLIMVATIAFGMGIDKSNVRFVAHLDLPKSIEAYYQETGRAGRDGLPADAWLAYGLEDVAMLRQLMAKSEGDEQHKRLEQHKLDALLGYCEITTCRRQALLAYFEDDMPEPCGNCDICLEPPKIWEATDAARKALSCIYRTGQRFGVNYLIDVLRGKANERVQRFGHDRISTFGIGKEWDADHWKAVFRQLVARGMAGVDVEGYGGLYLTDAARPVLRGEQQVHLREFQTKSTAKNKRNAAQIRFTGVDQILWERLRSKRQEIAQEQGMPPYVIFHDNTLADMVCHCPTTLGAFAQLSGVGKRKLEQYGRIFIDVIEQHRLEHDVEPKPEPPVVQATELSDTAQLSVNLLKQGLSVEHIIEQRELKPSTIYTHWAQAIEMGLLDIEALPGVFETDISVIADALSGLPNTEQFALKPLYEALEGAYDYGILRCVTAHLFR